MMVVTGSASFVGRELLRVARARGVPATGWDLVSGPTTDRVIDVGSREVDAHLPEAADVVVHLAAISRDPDCALDPEHAFRTNVDATLNLIRASKLRNVRHFVFASTEWVYGPAATKQVQTEESPIDITTLSSEYPLTKIVAERCLAAAADRGFCPVTVLRFGIIYGPREAHFSAVEQMFFNVRDQGNVSVRGSLQTGRHFVHVTDIADGILMAAGKVPPKMEIYNLGGPALIRLADVVRESGKLLGKEATTSEGDPSAVSVRHVSSEKARTKLGWTPKISLAEGLATLMQSGRK